MSPSRAILLLLNSNVLILSRPPVPSRVVATVGQKLNCVSLQTPLSQRGDMCKAGTELVPCPYPYAWKDILAPKSHPRIRSLKNIKKLSLLLWRNSLTQDMWDHGITLFPCSIFVGKHIWIWLVLWQEVAAESLHFRVFVSCCRVRFPRALTCPNREASKIHIAYLHISSVSSLDFPSDC